MKGQCFLSLRGGEKQAKPTEIAPYPPPCWGTFNFKRLQLGKQGGDEKAELACLETSKLFLSKLTGIMNGKAIHAE